MQINPYTTVRHTDQARGAAARGQIARTQAALSRAQLQLSTGKRLLRPSDDAGDAAIAQQLRATLELRQQYAASLAAGDRYLSDADEALGQSAELIREARTIAQANLDTGVSDSERQGAAVVLRQIEGRLLDLANTRSGGLSLFGGDRDVDPYQSTGAGVRFRGSDDVLANSVGGAADLTLMMSGAKTFGGASQRVGNADLAPAVTPVTKLGDLGGAAGNGVSRGVIRITNGAAVADVDLSGAETVGDVLTRINASGIGVTASLTAGGAIQLVGASVTVAEAGATTAADLGILNLAPAVVVTGQGLDPHITPFTLLGDLRNGAGIDSAGGFVITDGVTTDTVSLAGITTVAQLLERLNGSPVGVRAQISDDGTSLQLQSIVQGSALRVREDAGTTAADLGWLTFTAADRLADFNGGRGVRLDPAGPDLRLVDAGGANVDVELDGAGTAQDVVDRFNAAAIAAGSALTATFDPSVPGIVLVNVGRSLSLGESQAATDLGLDAPVLANTLVGRDVNPVTAEGVFGHLRSLIAALESNDAGAATRAIIDLEADEANLVVQRGEAGARMQEIEARLSRLEDQNLVTTEMLSRLEDADFAQTVLEFQTLQTSLQATLQTTGQIMGLSLLDFLR